LPTAAEGDIMKKFTKFMATFLAAATITISAASTSASALYLDTIQESRFLNDAGLCYDRWGETYGQWHWKEVSSAVDNAWAKAGVTNVSKYIGLNDYYINGKKVSRYAAFYYVAKKYGKMYLLKKYYPS
jgi:hypothetical protein